ncbi:MAG: ABC transporter ATP-binding protein [Chloroflexi bacterium]|nr:ABC transporter ATP-binding protein [Chloroflexota bacterium]
MEHPRRGGAGAHAVAGRLLRSAPGGLHPRGGGDAVSANGDRPAAVEAEAVSFSVEANALLDRVDVRAGRGQFVGLIGPNGAGKSTLLRTLAGVLRHQQGTVRLEASDLRSMTARDVARIVALIPQIAPYTQGFTALELVLMGRYPHLGRFEVEGEADDRIARSAMRLTETEELAARTLDTLSGGERQRVFVARALAQRPRILLLDEPTSNLDVLHQLTVLGLVRTLVDGGLTAIAAIHDLNLAARYCDRLVLLSNGRVLTEGRPDEVLEPETIESAFGVRSAVYRDPATGAIAVSLIGPAETAARTAG